MTSVAQRKLAPGHAFKRRLDARLPSLVVNVDHPSASLVESIGYLGVDAVFFDCEQGSLDIETVEHMARAARLAGVASLVRLWSRDAWMIERMLLRGVDGIVVPRVDDGATARAVVETVRYVLPAAHERTSVIVQIESAGALEALDDILSIDGIDAYFVGPVDLSKSLGHGGAIYGAEMAAIIGGTLGRIALAGKASGMLVNERTAADFALTGVSLLYCHANDFLRIGASLFRTRMDASKVRANTAGAADSTLTLSGGEAIVEILERAGVGPMFGMGGFQLLPFYDALRRKGLKHHLINDERCGAFAADAWARMSGRPGVCDATLGPGATNLVTALVESFNAGIAQVVIVGDTHRDHSWKNMTQETRQLDILRPAVKDVIRIERSSRVPEAVRRAFAVATSGRPGPVIVDVPEDVSHETFDYPVLDLWIDPATTRFPAYRSRPDARDIERAAAVIAGARRPLLLAGGGIHISGAYDALQAFAEAHAIPVAHTLSGKGAIACVHPLSAGLFGRYSRIANELIEASDCLIVAGCKMGEIATKRFQLFNGGAPIIHIEVLPEEIGRTTRTDHALVGDARLALEDLSSALHGDAAKARAARADYAAEVPARMRKWRDSAVDRLLSDEVPINMGRMLNELNSEMPAESVLVADGGFAAHWGGLLYDTKTAGRRFVADRGFASIGYGLPGAMGTQLAVPDQPVVAITGDGGFNMTIGELETARRADTPFTLMIVNNAASGYIKALQHSMYGAYQSADLVEMNYAEIANDFGCQGIRVEHPDQLAPAIRAANHERTRPSVIDVVVTRDPAKMLPGVDNRTLKVTKGDRPV